MTGLVTITTSTPKRRAAAEMTRKHNDGPAFPLPVDDEQCRARFESGYGGMTLRDYFAAQVIGPAFLDLFTGWRQRGEPVQEDWPMGLAIDAYRVADAMLKQRENT